MRKPAPTDRPILDVIAERWSPRALEPKAVSPDALATLFEAARWAASCFNEQPWAYVVVDRGSSRFASALECLSERNRLWASRAGVLVFACARQAFARNGKPNRWAFHDVGQANAHLALQAASMGLVLHQMAGFSPERVRDTFGVPTEWEPLTAIAVGHPGRTEDLDETFREAETRPRTRRRRSDFVFEERWGGGA